METNQAMTTELSLSAQLVEQASHEAWVTEDNPSSIAASALRAAIDQVAPEVDPPTDEQLCRDWVTRMRLRDKMLAIASELEGR